MLLILDRTVFLVN